VSPPTLLIVDDEVGILAALRRCLRREGFRILTATAPEEALALLEREPVDVILSDQRMPGLSGTQLLAEARRRRPGVRGVLLTGWSETVPEEALRGLGVRSVVPKPWDDAELKAVLRREVGAGSP